MKGKVLGAVPIENALPQKITGYEIFICAGGTGTIHFKLFFKR